MAVTQYIGARYVPKIYDNPDDNTNNWKQGVEYEPLTMVSYAGGSYTSKVPVPASATNPADAPQYWAYMGSSSGQITTNTNNISRIQHALANATEAGNVCTSARAVNDYVWIDGTLYRCTAAIAVNEAYVEGFNVTPITDMATALNIIQTISADVTDLQGDVLTLEGSITTLDGKISDLDTELSAPFTIMIGDSYAAGWTPDTQNDGWPVYLMQKGIRGVASYAGGAAFYLPESDNRSPRYLLDAVTLPAGVTAADVKRIVVAMGYNDFKQNTTTITTNMTNFVSHARAVYPNAIIYIGMCGYAWTQNEDAITGIDLYTTAFTYKKVANSLNHCVFMPQTSGCLFACDGMASDYKHPNDVGNKQIAAAIYAALNGQSFSARHYHNINCDSATYGITATWYMEFTITDGVINGFGRFTNFTVNNATAVNMNELQIVPAHFPVLPFNRFICADGLHNQDTTSGLTKAYYAAPWFITLGYHNRLDLSINLMNDAGNNYGSSKKFAINMNSGRYMSFNVSI